MSDLILLSGRANEELARGISDYLDFPLGDMTVSTFADGETRVELNENVRGRDVFVIQPTCFPTNQNIMEALIISDACKRASAGRVTLVNPYYGYARQERKEKSRSPITAKLVADLIEASGFDRVLTMELHAGAIQGFFNIPVDHLYGKNVILEGIKKGQKIDVVVSPDAGGVARARALAKDLGAGLAIIDKRRSNPNESEVMHVIGDVKDKVCLIYDDMCDTGGSLVKAASAIKHQGAAVVSAAVVHGVFSGPALTRIEESCLTRVITTDTIPAKNYPDKIEVVSVAKILSKAIKRIHNNESISSLF